jgi:hypothetical protein
MSLIGLELPVRKVKGCFTNPKPRRIRFNHGSLVRKAGPWIRTAQPKRTPREFSALIFWYFCIKAKVQEKNWLRQNHDLKYQD